MSKILITTNQVKSIELILQKLSQDRDVKEFEIMYNPIVKNLLIVRYKRYSTTEDGAIKLSIEYRSVNENGVITDATAEYGKEFYYALRDYVAIQLDNPSIEII